MPPYVSFLDSFWNVDAFIIQKPLYSNFLLPFWETVKFPCDIMNSDKKWWLIENEIYFKQNFILGDYVWRSDTAHVLS